jgi:hypothetical protein
VYLNDFYDVAQSDSGIVLEVTATMTDGKADIRVPHDDLARAHKSGRTYRTDTRAAAVLEAVNAVEVPPFAYPSSSYEHPNPANVSVFADSEAGDTLLVVRLRQDSPRLLECVTEIANGGFRGRFDYIGFGSPGWRTGIGRWRGTVAGRLLWDTLVKWGIKPLPGNAFTEVGFSPSRIIIEVYAVEDSVLSFDRLGSGRVEEARLQSELAGFRGADAEFYWLLQRALPFAKTNQSIVRKFLEGGPGGFGVLMRAMERNEIVPLVDLPNPRLSSTPKSMRLTERWALERAMKSSTSARDPREWSETQVKSAAKVERF